MKHRSHEPKHMGSQTAPESQTARDRVGDKIFRFVRRPYVAVPLYMSAVVMLGLGYNDVRDRLDPSRVERQVVDDNVGDVFGRRHIEIQCGKPLSPQDGDVRVSAKIEPGGYIFGETG